MRDVTGLKVELFMRVSEFGTAEAAAFPPASRAAELFADLNIVHDELDAGAARQSSFVSMNNHRSPQ